MDTEGYVLMDRIPSEPTDLPPIGRYFEALETMRDAADDIEGGYAIEALERLHGFLIDAERIQVAPADPACPQSRSPS